MRDGQGPNDMVAEWVKIFIAWMSQGRACVTYSSPLCPVDST